MISARDYQLSAYAQASRTSRDGPAGTEASLNKVFWSELDITRNESALDLLGPLGELSGGEWAESYVFSLAGPNIRRYK